MNYQQEQPDTLLKDFVRCYWWLENTTSKALHFTILPDGFFDLLLRCDNQQRTSVSLTGLWTEQINVEIAPNARIFGIQWRLLAVENILEQSIAPLLNTEKRLANDHWGLQALPFHDPQLMKAAINTHLCQLVANQKNIDPRKRALLHLINQTKGNETIAHYSQQVYWSSRQMNRYFKSKFGLSLKAYCNILKCAASFPQLKNGQLYPKQNYFDRSHFIKELKKYTGNTPKDLSKNENDRFLQLSLIKKK